VWTINGNNIYYNRGNVGIGTDGLLTERLNIKGNVIIIGNLSLPRGYSIILPGEGVDEDGDGYYRIGSSYVATIISSTGVRTTNLPGTDCYDRNASAHPGQTRYFQYHRGDNSFDYDCDRHVTYMRRGIKTFLPYGRDIGREMINSTLSECTNLSGFGEWWRLTVLQEDFRGASPHIIMEGDTEYSCPTEYFFAKSVNNLLYCYRNFNDCSNNRAAVQPYSQPAYRR
ncbi:MAG: hypothetical protein QXU40_02870, partial [Candidatus Pacearchaeota archaeon]